MAKKHKKNKPDKQARAAHNNKKGKLSRKYYEDELEKLQGELVKLQFWVRKTGAKVIIVFEGRDAAGKGGVIKRITERVSPRVFKVIALPAPSEREKSQLYIQRYLSHFPAAGEVVMFDRSWYNRAGVERVMGFCTDHEYQRFMRLAPAFERTLADNGILLIKYWFDVSMDEQQRRFQDRIDDERKQWKLSPMDTESFNRWYDYSRARDAMFEGTDTDDVPWYVVPSDDKKRARLNCISHLLNTIPYKELPRPKVKLGKRDLKGKYDDETPLKTRRTVPAKY
ncbi:MAG: polyphosphate kinase 2 [Gammaproteobacteria bacterium]|nr:polyphosphate kinase 2 [Gammaproteobacteria bacterium]MDH3970542.1 polyphosphate kinase 2 [Gammaproteobacteria bacterium]